jgi:hypothetical protein
LGLQFRTRGLCYAFSHRLAAVCCLMKSGRGIPKQPTSEKSYSIISFHSIIDHLVIDSHISNRDNLISVVH